MTETATTTVPILQTRNLCKEFPIRKWLRTVGSVKAVGGISFALHPKQTLAIVGESGCGKSTLAKLLMQIETATSGEIELLSKPLATVPIAEYRRTIQMIFQDPYSSLNPRKRIWEIIAEPLLIAGELPRQQCRQRAESMMTRVGLRPEFSSRYPHMFSGGQRQRIGIARALVTDPRILICDEPVSALDVSIQAQILNLLADLQDSSNLSYIFISHDLSVVRHIADEVMVIYLGRVMEYGPKKAIFTTPCHPYTRALLASAPSLHEEANPIGLTLTGELPSPLNPPSGCVLNNRCPLTTEICRTTIPPLRQVRGRQVACHHAE